MLNGQNSATATIPFMVATLVHRYYLSTAGKIGVISTFQTDLTKLAGTQT
jgi:hypothetical protein